MEYININGKEYQFVIGYGKSNELRKSLNDLTQKIFGFNFEQWYQDGYWKNQYIPYSLIDRDGDKLISNVSVNVMDFKVFGEEKRYIQLGTVMTDPDYRKQGLVRVLIKKAIADYRDKCDLIYLFANNSVLNFYPKIGFEELKQYQCVSKVDVIHTDISVKRLNMSDKNNRSLVIDKVMHAVPVSKVSMCTNAELIMFYCTLFMKNNVYYSENYDAVLIADFTENTVEVMDIFCTKNIPLNRILNALTNKSVTKIVLFFTPQDTSSYETILLEGEDTLFAMGKDLQLLKSNQFMFSKLSHT